MSGKFTIEMLIGGLYITLQIKALDEQKRDACSRVASTILTHACTEIRIEGALFA